MFRLLSIELNEGLGCRDFDIFSGSAQILHGIAAYVVDNECVIWILFTVRWASGDNCSCAIPTIEYRSDCTED